MLKNSILHFGICLLLASTTVAQDYLEDRLASYSLEQLANSALQQGDSQRGALVFYQHNLNCAKCHIADNEDLRLAPDLALKRDVTIEHLVESLLKPGEKIFEGFETAVIQTHEGQTISGVLVDKNDAAIKIMRIENPEQIEEHVFEDIDWKIGKRSTMPEGLVNQLADQQQFYDLVKYLYEIAQNGPVRAIQLRPASVLTKLPPLPEYERRIDHAGIIENLDEDSLERGQKIYRLRCASCHGTLEKEGSLPTSLRFAKDPFKNGADPHSMYETLTEGFGMMNAQRWMVPQQKYDVIHYIRHTFLQHHNRSQFVEVDDAYLDCLPEGDTRGPEPMDDEPWLQMDYGPSLINTIEVGRDGANIAQKGIVVRLDDGPGGVESGRHWMMYEHDTMRLAAAWSGQFIDWNGIHFNGVHGQHPRVSGEVHFENDTGPGWARPSDQSFVDDRVEGRDGKMYGPFRRDWIRFRGMYRYANRSILRYDVGNTAVFELPALTYHRTEPIFVRQFNIESRDTKLCMQVAEVANSVEIESGGHTAKSGHMTYLVSGNNPQLTFRANEEHLLLDIGAGDQPIRFSLFCCPDTDNSQTQTVQNMVPLTEQTPDLNVFVQGGPKNWPQVVETVIDKGDDNRPYAVDYLSEPADNPWDCRVRLTGIDFSAIGESAFVTAWDGSVWRVDGIHQTEGNLRWHRIAAGLFQPLGVKIVDGQLFVTCRDQIVRLHDLNNDGEMDWYENFNSDHQVTEHFHEFAMGLQTDAQGNLYYAKSARHALTAVVPHHGTLLKVAPDGHKTEIVANGFRAANGVCLNPDGTFFVTDQEGHWNPKNRINWVKPGGFYGNMFGYHDVTDASDEAMDPPMCWITNAFDRSPAELLWVQSDKWGPLQGSLLNLSYGYGQIFVVPHEKIDGLVQGGMCAFPLERLPTGIMRGRFHPNDGQLYSCGMFAWAGDQQRPGGLYRIRFTGQPVFLPIELNVAKQRLRIKFSGKIDRGSASQPENYRIETWRIKRTANYGSDHFDEKVLEVASVRLAADDQTVELVVPDIKPTHCMEIVYSLRTADGAKFDGKIHNTIHRVANKE